MFTNRNFTRHPTGLKVELFVEGKWQEFVTADVSRKGVFVRIGSPKYKEGQAIQMRIELPDRRVLPMLAQVRRVVQSALQSPTGTGVGLEFSAIGADLRAKWDDFIQTLRQKKVSDGFVENSQNLRDMLPPPHVRELLKKMRESGELVSAPPMTRATEDLQPIVVEIAPQSTDRLTAFAERCARGGAVFLRPKHRCDVGRRLSVVLVHPATDEEHVVHAVAERVVYGDDRTYAGVQVRFAPLPEREQRSLAEFVARRTADIDLPAPPPGLSREF